MRLLKLAFRGPEPGGLLETSKQLDIEINKLPDTSNLSPYDDHGEIVVVIT